MLHRIAAVIATDAGRSRFLVQRKDESYRYPLALALFGGAVEAGESDRQAIEREIVEELGIHSAMLLLDAGLDWVAEVDLGYPFVLFEAVMRSGALDVVAERPVFEGKRAEIVARDLLLTDPSWMPGLVEVLRVYLSRRSPAPTPDPRS
jgi:8-oxo-dGTP pyrophosphatase MutT (NUDIX family)